MLLKQAQKMKVNVTSDENETKLIENEQIQTNSKSSQPDHYNEEISKLYNLTTLDIRESNEIKNDEPGHRIKTNNKTKLAKKQRRNKWCTKRTSATSQKANEQIRYGLLFNLLII